MGFQKYYNHININFFNMKPQTDCKCTFKYVSAGSKSAMDLNQTPGPSENDTVLQLILLSL